MCREGLQTVVQSQLTVRHVEKRRVATVAVEKDQLARLGTGDAAADVVENGEQRRGRQPYGARCPGVFVRLRVRQRGKKPDVQIRGRGSDRGFGDRRRDHFVGVQWQVRTVLFDCAERLDEDRVGSDLPVDIGATQFAESSWFSHRVEPTPVGYFTSCPRHRRSTHVLTR